MGRLSLPGINIQAPWAEAILSGRKTIETRYYPMPKKWEGQPLAIIETPGRKGRFRSRVAGFIIFGRSHCYESKTAFLRDKSKHLVDPEDAVFGWRDEGKPKWGWPIVWSCRYTQELSMAFRRGIRYSSAVPITKPPPPLLETLSRSGFHKKHFRALP